MALVVSSEHLYAPARALQAARRSRLGAYLRVHGPTIDLSTASLPQKVLGYRAAIKPASHAMQLKPNETWAYCEGCKDPSVSSETADTGHLVNIVRDSKRHGKYVFPLSTGSNTLSLNRLV